MEGQIIKISSDLYFVESLGKIYPCKCRGLFRKEHITPVVGDYVLFHGERKFIEKVLPRKNIFDRPKVSNIDQAFIVTSLVLPDISFSLLDKFLILMEIHHVKPIICITKEDLISDSEWRRIQSFLQYYEKIGYLIVYHYEIDKIKKLLKNKTSVFTGQTGAGKTTLLNQLNLDWNLETGEVSIALGRGKHTTRTVELFPFLGGKVIDTPGFSSLEVSSYSKEDIQSAFIEFSSHPCLYKDCMHMKEEGCGVIKGVLDHSIMESRYLHYLSFIGGEVHEKN